MHVILATVGTDGDVFPYVGLGRALRARGHRVTLAGPETYKERSVTLGLEFCPLVTAEEVSRMLAHPDMWHPLKCGPMMARWGMPMMPRQYEALAGLAKEPDAVLVANPGLLPARLVQEKRNVPLASLLLQPGLIQSCCAPPEMTGGLTIPPWLPMPLRRAYWLGLDAVGYVLVARPLNRLRAGLGLPPVRRVFRWWLSQDLVIALFPPWYARPQPDWPPQIRLAGFGRYDGAKAELPDNLLAFCRAGPPPVAFTLGTGMAHAAAYFRTAVAACLAAGVRGILLTKFPDVVPTSLPPTVRHCPFAPFRQLLPLCGAVVHHGGVGTTAAALEAGCPQLVLPLAWDQPDNAARVTRLGVGLTLGTRQRSARHLARALAHLMSPSLRERCRAVASQAAERDGLEIAADLVEQVGKNECPESNKKGVLDRARRQGSNTAE
jgi:UDP:flavonoid glycosyltransferase YjiC (YdhE family)